MIIASTMLTIIFVIGSIIVYHWWARKKINAQKLLLVATALFVLSMMFWGVVTLDRILQVQSYLSGNVADVAQELRGIELDLRDMKGGLSGKLE